MVKKEYTVFFLGICLVLWAGIISGCSSLNAQDGPVPPKNAEQGIVKRVVDGDTFVLEDGRKVRMIGINTPESVDPRRPVEFYGKEASRYATKILEGQNVLLEWGRNPKDRYGRWLAWVWLLDGTFINGYMVEQGYAQVYTFKDNPDHANYLLDLQKKAREEGRGLWEQSEEEPKQEPKTISRSNSKFVASINSKVYHEWGCPGAKNIEKHNEVLYETEDDAKASGRRMCKVSGCTEG